MATGQNQCTFVMNDTGVNSYCDATGQKFRPMAHKSLARHRLSHCSHEPWVPTRAEPPKFVLYDLVWASLSLLLSGLLLYAAGLHTHWCLRWWPLLSFAVVFAFSSLVLEPVSYDKMLQAEAALLATVRSDVQHRWTVRHYQCWSLQAFLLLEPIALRAAGSYIRAAVRSAYPVCRSSPLVMRRGRSTRC